MHRACVFVTKLEREEGWSLPAEKYLKSVQPEKAPGIIVSGCIVWCAQHGRTPGAACRVVWQGCCLGAVPYADVNLTARCVMSGMALSAPAGPPGSGACVQIVQYSRTTSTQVRAMSGPLSALRFS